MSDDKINAHFDNDDLEQEAAQFASLTPEQASEREDIVKAIGQRCNALMRYDGKDPALVASALLWCGISMYAQGAPDLTREGMLLVCGSTWDEANLFIKTGIERDVPQPSKEGSDDGSKQDV